MKTRISLLRCICAVFSLGLLCSCADSLYDARREMSVFGRDHARPKTRYAMVAGSAVPLAHPVPNLRGYVRTPFTTPRMLVDVRGLSTGSKAVCPYTGRAFLVPGAYTYPAIDFSTSGRPSESSRSHYASVTRSSQLPVSTSIVELPYASPMVGRPGFVKSPYTMGREVVDVTGLPAGMEVRCPYTGRLFRVPPQ